jgi:glutathione S-transferase
LTDQSSPLGICRKSNNFLSFSALYPSDPKEKAKCLCWQAWEQTTYAYEVFQLYEMEVVSAAMQVR